MNDGSKSEYKKPVGVGCHCNVYLCVGFDQSGYFLLMAWVPEFKPTTPKCHSKLAAKEM
jgi:hypothetical protein